MEEATRLSCILKDFLDFARPRSPDLAPVDVREIIDRVRTNMDQQIQTRHIRWSGVHENGLTPVILGDRDLLYQAFLNMAMNALEAMEDGGSLTIRTSLDDSRIRVDFQDSGHGIAQEHLQKIFTPFFTTHEMGTGLGLSVVLNIVTAHNGEVSVQSKEGKGTRFSIFLPRSDQFGGNKEDSDR
ncbi:MAG: two-component sensor histidine kinase, partial [Deltaproteobacteria bacterium]|nr:two-component sensor histidine kinase [Deltaproteobacteria bacterium]